MSIFSLKSRPDQPEEFQEVLRTHGDLAYRMACQLTGGREAEARDLVQEVFIRIWKNWDTHRPNSLKGWMYRVLQNLYLDAARRRARYPSISLEAPNDQDIRWEDALTDGRPSIEQSLEQQDVQRQVQHALTRVDEEFRLPVILCDMEGLAYEDISRILSCPIGTVRSRIHRGRQQLRQLLKLMPLAEVPS